MKFKNVWQRQEVRFLFTGIIASGIDYFLYLFLVELVGMEPLYANAISFPTSVLVNFFLQKHFVFELKRPLKTAFGLSMLVSVGGFLLSMGIIYTLNLWPFFQNNQYITKLVDKAIVIVYNFFCKRFAFEKRFLR